MAEETGDRGGPPPGLGRHPAEAFGGGSTLLTLHKRKKSTRLKAQVDPTTIPDGLRPGAEKRESDI